MSEADYDREIAPDLMRLAKRCEELGMPFVASVEYEPGSRGTTAAAIAADNIAMQVIWRAARLGNNLDGLMIELARVLRDRGLAHNSIALKPFIACDPADR